MVFLCHVTVNLNHPSSAHDRDTYSVQCIYTTCCDISAADVTVNMSMTTSFPGVLSSRGGESEYTHDVAHNNDMSFSYWATSEQADLSPQVSE